MKKFFVFLRRHRLLFIAAFAAFILAVLVLEELAFLLRSPDVFSEGRNAMWLRHSWVGEKHVSEEYQKLARMLREGGITDAYFHVGPLDANGAVDKDRYENAGELIRILKRIDPKVRLQAWLGQVEAKGGGPLDLSSMETRRSIVRMAGTFLDLGFDGIHYDIEPVYSGDRNFIALLKDTHKLTESRNAVLSVAAYEPELMPGMEQLAKLVVKNPGAWERNYFLDVAREVDQVAVMTYDSAIPLPGLYGRSIGWTVKWSVNHGIKDLLIGIPTYDAKPPAHIGWVENINNAVKGLKLGAAGLDMRDRKKVGAAVYAEWTTSPKEWKVYISQWVR